MNTRFQRSEAVLTADFDDALLMMSVDQGSYFDVNSTGARIWALLAQPSAEAELVATLVTEYDVPSTTCAAQVAEFIALLRERDLVVDAS